MKSFIVAGAVLSLIQIAHSCAIVEPADLRAMSVQVTSESALIVWDEKTKTEHFIRRANFSGEAKEFGFIVPTPSKPSLGTTKDGLFKSLEEEIKPETITKVNRNYEWTLYGYFNRPEETATSVPVRASAGEEAVEVIEETKVGGYDATVLRADDATTLGAWLRKHSYSAPPSVEKWLQFYTARQWYLTAFKVSAEGKPQDASLVPVRISFETKQPFYPYHEPETASNERAERSLRVFFVGNQRVEANIVSPEQTEKWQANTPFSSGLKHSDALTELGGVPPESMGGARLTAFEDFSSPRHAFGDLYFSPSTNQSNLVPEPIIDEKEQNFLIPLDVIGVIALIAGVMLISQRRNS